MRIVGGMWRGKPLEAPDGRDVTRPTTDRVREAISSMVVSARGLDLSADHVLDAFAGSGACGLELLSRGCAHATFVDRDRDAIARIRRNAASVGAASSAFTVIGGDVDALASRGRVSGGPFDIVMLDPPYAVAAEHVAQLVAALRDHDLLANGCVVVYERSAVAPALELDGLVPVKLKRYGQTAVDLLRLESMTS